MVYGPRFRERKIGMRRIYLGQSYRYNPNTKVKTEVQNFYTIPDPSKLIYAKRCWDETHPGPPYREGGPLTICEATLPWDGRQGDVHQKGSGTFNYHYEGGFVPMSFGNSSFTQNDIGLMGIGGNYNEPYLSAEPYGPEVYNKARPKLEHGGLGVFLAELRDLPRMLRQTAGLFKDSWKASGGDMKSRFMRPKRVADDFLNTQFGWVPFLRDIHKMYDTYSRSEAIIAQIERDNGQYVKRTRVVEHIENASDPVRFINNAWPAISPVLNGLQFTGAGSYTDIHVETVSHVWFEAQFRYYLPQFDRGRPWYHSRYGDVMRQATIYGARISPAVIWKATPWSWLADWVSNVGQNIDYYTAQHYDNLTSRYAYVMKHTKKAVVNTSYCLLKGTVPFKGQWYSYLETKDRREASSPFGFSLSMDSLSPRQIAILTALGISKGG